MKDIENQEEKDKGNSIEELIMGHIREFREIEREFPDIADSELEFAIQKHKNIVKNENLHNASKGNGGSLTWNCCASLYVSMKIAQLQEKIISRKIAWNTIIRSIVMRMTSDEDRIGEIISFNELVDEGYMELKIMNELVTDAFKVNKPYIVEPIVNKLTEIFGVKNNNTSKALTTIVYENIDFSKEMILPHFAEIF